MYLKTKTTYRQRKFRKMLRKQPVIIATSSDQCAVSTPFRGENAVNLAEAERGHDFGGYASGGLPETNRRKF